jgi:signal transduction histidine kinase
MDSGVEEAELEAVNLDEVLEQLVCRRTPRAAVHCEIAGPVVLDRRRLERVLANLLDNADAYAGGAVEVGAVALHGTLQIHVDDAGPGIPPGEREAIFERMHRGSAARASDARGSGLGLALAREHLRLQGGTLRVEDAPTGGARFVIELPLRRAGP